MKQNKLYQIEKNRKRSEAFTLVELIVVIAIIGMLAVITIVGFGAWRTRAAGTEVNSDLMNMKAGMEDVRNRTNAYPTYTTGTQFNGANSTKIVFTQSKNVTVTYSSGTATTYCVNAQSDDVPSVTMFVNMASSNKNPQVGSC